MNLEERPLSTREIQMVEYNILKKLVKLFEENGIHYVFGGGTLLGAVRHNGFIPWDDDIDIFIPRDDYERLKALAEGIGHKFEGIELRLPGDYGFPYSFIKAVDKRYVAMEDNRTEEYQAYAWVDIFPLDHFPDQSIAHRFWLMRLSALIMILSSNTVSDDYMRRRGYYSEPIKRVMFAGSKVLCSLLGGSSCVAKRIDYLGKKMDSKFKKSNHVGNGALPNGMKDFYEVAWFEPVMKHAFEDGVFNIPVNYDANLTNFYGDYMQLPPEEKRAAHEIEVYRVIVGSDAFDD